MTDLSFALEVPPPTLEEILTQAGIKVLGGPTEWGNSWWSKFSKCAYEGALAKVEGWFSGFREPLFTGGLIHECLARHYTDEDPTAPAIAVCAWCSANAQGVWAEIAQTMWAIGSNVNDWIRAYVQFWPPYAMPQGVPWDIEAVRRFEIPKEAILGVEFELEASSPFPYSLRGDLVFRCRDWTGQDAVAYVDHKSTSRSDGDWNDGWWMDGQMLGTPYLWNKLMVPQGYPPMRYVVVNGIVKPTKWNNLVHPAFVRNVYPVRDSAVAMWTQTMVELNERRLGYEMKEATLKAAGASYQLHDVYPQSGAYASCFSRRYGLGRCDKLDHCLNLQPTSATVTPQQETTALPPMPAAQPLPPAPGGSSALVMGGTPPSGVGDPVLPGGAVDPAGLPAATPPPTVVPPTPAGVVEPLAPVGEAPPGSASPLPSLGAAAPTGATIPQVPAAAEMPLPVATSATEPPFECVPCPDDPETKVISIDKAPWPSIRADQAVAGWPYYLRGIVAWATGMINEEDNAVFEKEGHIQVGFARDTEAHLCAPIIKGKGAPPPPVPEAKEDAEAPVIGESFIAGAGTVPVIWLGSFNMGGRKLADRMRAVSTGPSYGLAHVGKNPSKRKIKAFIRKLEPDGSVFVVETKKSTVGTDTWVALAQLAPALPEAEPEDASPDGSPPSAAPSGDSTEQQAELPVTNGASAVPVDNTPPAGEDVA